MEDINVGKPLAMNYGNENIVGEKGGRKKEKKRNENVKGRNRVEWERGSGVVET